MFPQPLKTNDQIAIISPSGKIDYNFIEGSKNILEQWGFEVILGKSVCSSSGRFAGTDANRLKDLQWALDSNDIQAILCSRGGYGAVRLLDKLSFSLFNKNPKWIIGYSDITVLHAAITKQGIASLHAPMCRHLAEEGADQAALFLRDILTGRFPVYSIPCHALNKTGKATGTLYGGNLSVLSGLRGTPYDIISENTILFIEDIGEKPYRIERMLYNFKLSGILGKISGLIVGRFTEYEEDESLQKTLYQSIKDLVSEYDYPVCFNFPVGHTKENYPLICNAPVSFSVDEKNVVLSFINNRLS